jgi:hypothetical protein
VLLAYCFDALKKMYKTTSALIEDSKLREKEQEESLVKLLGEVSKNSRAHCILRALHCSKPSILLHCIFLYSGRCQREQSRVRENCDGEL